jgi:uncharacterized UBP type Zn finger protein
MAANKSEAFAKQRRENVAVEKTGAFNMDIVHAILKETTIENAKAAAMNWIKTHVETEDCGVKPENIRKAKTLIENSNSVSKLGIGMSNFILAFQGFAVVKSGK